MQKTTFISVLKAVAALCKQKTDPVSVPNWDVMPFQQYAVFIQRHVQLAWEYANWRDLIVLEQRTLDANGFLAYEQNGFARIGKIPPDSGIYGIFENNPNTALKTAPRAFYATAGGIQVVHGPVSGVVWVKYQAAPPRFSTTYYVADANNYNPGDVVFWPVSADEQVFGNCYEAREQADGTMGRWEEQVIPACFAQYVIQAAFAEVLKNDSQLERGMEELKAADELLYRAKAYWATAQGLDSQARVRVA